MLLCHSTTRSVYVIRKRTLRPIARYSIITKKAIGYVTDDVFYNYIAIDLFRSATESRLDRNADNPSLGYITENRPDDHIIKPRILATHDVNTIRTTVSSYRIVSYQSLN